jgi:hypothetical protein
MALKSKTKETSDSAMDVIGGLARTVGDELQPYLKDLLVTLGVKLASKDQSQAAQACLTAICESGKDAYTIVKQKVPTFQF